MKDSKTYRVRVDYSEKGGRHEISEKWEVRGTPALKRTLCDALDLVKDEGGFAKNPVLAELERNLDGYADEDFVRETFARQKKAYRIHEKIMQELANGSVAVTLPLDRRTRITVSGN